MVPSCWQISAQTSSGLNRQKGIRFVNATLSSPEHSLRLSDCLVANHQITVETL